MGEIGDGMPVGRTLTVARREWREPANRSGAVATGVGGIVT